MKTLVRSEEDFSFNEIRKTRIIVTLYCLLLLYRTYQTLNCYFYYQGGLMVEEWVFSCIYISLVVLLIFRNSWFMPLMIALLQAKFDSYFGVNTVGSVITIYINFYFAAFYFILKQFNLSNNKDHQLFNQKIYNCKYLLAILWGVANLYALENHLKDSYWINGTAFELMLCNPFLSPFYETFRNLYLSGSPAYFFICKIASYIFIIMQSLMLPFLFIRKIRFMYYVSMLIYLIGITVFIDVSFLAHFAWLLFFLLLPQISFSHKKIYVQKSPLQFCKTLPRLNRAFTIVLLLFVLINTPKLDKAFMKVVWFFREWDSYRYVDRKLHMIGLGKANLFNAYQIESASKWFTIYKKENNEWQMVPLIDTAGRKLSYGIDWFHTVNHGSDFLWLANTFAYAIGVEKVDYSNSITPYKMEGPVYERLIRFDFNKYSTTPTLDYKVHFYSNIKARGSANPFTVSSDSIFIYSCTKKRLVKSE